VRSTKSAIKKKKKTNQCLLATCSYCKREKAKEYLGDRQDLVATVLYVNTIYTNQHKTVEINLN